MKPTSRQPATHLLLTVLSALLAAGPVTAQTAPSVVNGQATFDRSGSVYTITNTPGAIIQWQGFSVGAGEITRFLQQSTSSTVLNRVTGQDPSRILGTLQSNGKVVLVNPNGVLFGAGARVDVNGLVASSLALSDKDFLAGRMHFAAGATAGKVANQGRITTPTGGSVYLIASDVGNSGVIQAPGGEVLLAAGRRVQLVDSSSPDLHVVVSAPADQAINLGQVMAAGGKVGIYGSLVNQRGTVNADSAVVDANGRIVFKAARDLVLDGGSVTTASGAGTGGSVTLMGERVGLLGDTRVDASGQLGGGTVLVGGDAHGANSAVTHAKQVLLAKDSSIKADAIASGNGGKVVAWSDGTTRAAGSISARGGSQAGDGGWVEVSGKTLDMRGRVDTRAPRGRTGSLLLDPTNIFIATDQAAAADAGMAGEAVAAGGDSSFGSDAAVRDSLLTVDALQGLLEGAMVTVTTQNDSGLGVGNITVVNPVTWGSDTSLTLRADAAIHINAPVVATGLGSVLHLHAGTGIDVNAELRHTRDNGVLNLVAGSAIAVNSQIRTTGDNGLVTLSAGTGIALHGQISGMNGSRVAMQTTAGDIVQTAPGTLSVQFVSARADTGAVKLGTETNFIGELAGFAGGADGFSFRNGGLLQIADVGAESGIQASGSGPINLSSDTGILVNRNIMAGNGNVTLDSGAGSVEMNGGFVTSDGGRITIEGAIVQPTQADCAVNPALPNCAAILPSLAQCIAAPAAPGCNVVLPSLATCTAEPATAGCSAVLPSLAMCSAEPTMAGCGAVLPTLATCTAAPTTSGCSAVLPSVAVCSAAPSTAGCSAILPSLATCVAAPTIGGCSAVLPSVAMCTAAPSTAGCSAVLPSLATCVAAPASAGCSAVLPSVAVCSAAPSTAGCSAVLPSLASCIAAPTAPGCSAVLPSLTACVVTPALAGCNVLLPSLATCTVSPATVGCSVVLPSLASCTANPARAGCATVLPTLLACTANPSAAGCSAVLPGLGQCVSAPATQGCAVVLPSLPVCIVSATTAGCSAVLPTLAQCVASPMLQGCSAVLPSVSTCIVSPSAPGCAVVVPPIAQGSSGLLPGLCNDTSQSMNTVLAISSGAVGGGISPPAAVKAQYKAADQKDEKKQDQATPTTASGVQTVSKKTYCN